ncbi:hypothetical protein [Paenibacillus sp. P32E]|uniref:hypothetical protein n=1 Tax=Paenibacillus sp. P32E TaxID=1349434 RepID=UPI00093FC1E6|nr:hypothetical protein [Paenibacillus sp. P32E]OKP94770.1 hypothetical protein A3848_02000 [Paenibacillus sp. P32E]
MSIQLPLGDSPINGYQHHAFPLLISSLHPDFFQWFNCNYIQIYCNKDIESGLNFNFYDFPSLKSKSPFLGEMYIPKSLIERYVNPIKFLIDSLENNHYIVTFVDEFYIPERVAYQKYHYIHDILIYGYDNTRKIFNVAGYNNKRVLGTSEVEFLNFEKAFYSTLATGDLAKWADGMHLLQLKPENSYNFDLEIFIEFIEDYLSSSDTSYRLRMYENNNNKFIYGMDTYNSIIKYLMNIEDEIDIRFFHIFYEHKKCMFSRIRFLIDELGIHFNPLILEEYFDIERNALISRNLSLKYEIIRQEQVISKIIQIIREIKCKEDHALNLLVNDLKNT